MLPRMCLDRGHARDTLEAHTMRSASATRGATELSEPCARLGEATRPGRLDGAASVFERSERELRPVERAIRTELAGSTQA